MPPVQEFSAQKKLAPIPAPYRNVWAMNAADCANPLGPTRINVDPATISFPEGRFDVVTLNDAAEGQLLVNVRTPIGALQTHILHLSDEAQTLSYTSPGILRTYHRCGI